MKNSIEFEASIENSDDYDRYYTDFLDLRDSKDFKVQLVEIAQDRKHQKFKPLQELLNLWERGANAVNHQISYLKKQYNHAYALLYF